MDMKTESCRQRSFRYSPSKTSSMTTTLPSALENTVSGSLRYSRRVGSRKKSATQTQSPKSRTATAQKSHTGIPAYFTANAMPTATAAKTANVHKTMEYPSLASLIGKEFIRSLRRYRPRSRSTRPFPSTNRQR